MAATITDDTPLRCRAWAISIGSRRCHGRRRRGTTAWASLPQRTVTQPRMLGFEVLRAFNFDEPTNIIKSQKN
jgi:hypothetical protein